MTLSGILSVQIGSLRPVSGTMMGGASQPDKALLSPTRTYLGGEDKVESVGILCNVRPGPG